MENLGQIILLIHSMTCILVLLEACCAIEGPEGFEIKTWRDLNHNQPRGILLLGTESLKEDGQHIF